MLTNILSDFHTILEETGMPKGKKKVLLSAIKLFARQGYAGTSTAQIAGEAAVSQATIFKYFKTKEDLLLEILSVITPILRDDFTERLATFSNLEDFVHFIVVDRSALIKANKELFQILLQEVLIQPRIQDRAKTIFTTLTASVTGNLRRIGEQNANFDSELPDSLLIRAFVGQLAPYFIQHFILGCPIRNEKEELALIEKQILKLLCK
ncbi:TetR/AcrR family transcriptional regulator [Streptococcus massiliensis]|uniref:Transcriptional regulator n=1 Tax=Streptococcus massiliensis TaxID=313439 RepID=A0A380KYZ3_9STRE|nr:TetR/AcrR family transcriptional regulator [Streptococcus massiliensis]SUN76938.1 transcriptional regulator [Streptococcus massiliensis]